MNPQRRREIRKFVTQLREHFGLSTPVDLEQFIKAQLSGSIVDKEDLDVDARIKKSSEGTFEIELRSQQKPTRRRFSLAHELGHLFIHMGYKFNPDLWNKVDEHTECYNRKGFHEEEYDANEFAAELLMPEEEFRKFVKEQYQQDNLSENAIAEHFDVSIAAALNRCRWLGIIQW